MATYTGSPREQPKVYDLRPAIYYNEGSFDPPSSDDESDGLLEKDAPTTPRLAESGEWNGLVVGGSKKRVSAS
jgi:dipeptidyl aminopeptidase